MRTLQEIYDFCLLDRTYNAYFSIPDPFDCKSREQYRYYHAPVCSRGVSRAGTFIYGQSQMQLHRFLGIRDFRDEWVMFHIDAKTYEITDPHLYDSFAETIYITTGITRMGVRIRFTHPFNRTKDIFYDARSHNEYTKEGVRRDVVNYINKHLLYPPGRYRDLQMEYKIRKEDFVKWYKTYKKTLQAQYDMEYWKMYDRYYPDNSISFEESYSILEMYGAFYDFGVDDEYERESMAEDFMRVSNGY
jgi:hypothetical protein